jgi:hypothetical protein
MSAIVIPLLEGRDFRNCISSYLSAIAIFFQQSTGFKEILLFNCKSALPQAIEEV